MSRKSMMKRKVPPPPSRPSSTIRSTLAENIATGITFGAGSAMGHRAVDAVMGPREMNINTTMHPQDIQTNTPIVNNEGCQKLKDTLLECQEKQGDCAYLYELLYKMKC